MTTYSYSTILAKAKNIKQKAEKEYTKSGGTWGYYIAKSILKPKTAITQISIKKEEKSTGNDFGRQIKKTDYINMAERFTKYVEKHKQLPNNIKIGNKLMRVSDYTLMFANILIEYDTNKQLPKEINVNSKVFTKPTETSNSVLAHFKKKTGINIKYIDDFCDWCKNKVTYEFYYDDKKSNKEVIDSKAGNCVDLTHVACNIAEGLGYEWKVVHTRCNKSGTGHVYPMFRKKGINNGEWFIRDVACIADESEYCIWCKVGSGGTLIAYNPSWFVENLKR